MCIFQDLTYWNAPWRLSRLSYFSHNHIWRVYDISVRKAHCSDRLQHITCNDIFSLDANTFSQLRRAAIERPLQAQAEHGNHWGLNLQGFWCQKVKHWEHSALWLATSLFFLALLPYPSPPLLTQAFSILRLRATATLPVTGINHHSYCFICSCIYV